MIDEITEVGNYTFQIRLFDESMNSRATLPEVNNGIEIREPIATEDITTTNEVGKATVGYALTTAATPEDAFDTEGNYNKTTWGTGDRITAAKLNKIEAGIDGVNKKVSSGGSGGTVDLSGYVTKETGNASQITFADGQTFQAKLDAGTLKGEKGDKGDQGIQGEKGDKGSDGLTTSISLNGVTYAQENGVITLPNITSGGNAPSVTQIEPEALDMPKVFFNGDKPTNKTSVNATIEYISKTEHFKGYVDIKCQGNSSMAYPKKNYTIKMFSDEARSTKLKKDFKGWGKQSKFCLKANYIDHSHARNIISAKLWGQVVKSRSDFDTLPEELKTSPNYGAVDGFPIKVYYNNTYEGVYTWNIPKDGWMNNMDDKLNTHCILCGEEYNSGCFRSANASLWSDELHDVMPANIVTSFNNFQSFVINSSNDEFKTGLSTYADVNSLIDYYIFQYVICGLDSMGKNQLFFTYDGIKWIASSYDMDSTFGMYWNGGSFVSATYRMQEDYESMTSGRPGNLLYIRMEELFCDEIKARYAELRAGVLSYANIVNEFERFMDVIGKDLYAEDLTIYTGIPSGSTNNIQQIRNYTRDRLTYVDTQIEALIEPIPCTGIVLSADTLSFTTTDTQTLSVVVSPNNCTEAITWSVSPSGIVTVDNGVVTPVANGDCTITATCGSQSDTCAVTVSGMSESGGDTDTTLLYSLPEETVFNGTSTYIDTGVALLSTDQDFTIVLDVTATKPQTNAQATLFHCMHEASPYPGLSIKAQSINSGLIIPQGNNASTIGQNPYLIPQNIRTKVVVIKEGTTLSAYNSNNFAGSSTYTYSQVNENLLIGAYQTTDGNKDRYFLGTVYDFKIYNKAFTSQEKDAYLDLSTGVDENPNSSRVFKIDSTCMNTPYNVLIDSVAGIKATLTGNPTVSNNQIAFTASDTFSFDISSLNLTNSNRTFRIKFTPTTLDNNVRNVIGVGSSNNWNNMTTSYVSSSKLVLQHGNNGFINSTAGDTNAGNNDNRLSTTPVTGQEYELVISENIDGNVRYFIDGTLVQNGTATLFDPLYISNTEGTNRFIGSYSLIEIYNEYCNDYTEFTDMVNN